MADDKIKASKAKTERKLSQQQAQPAPAPVQRGNYFPPMNFIEQFTSHIIFILICV